MSAPKEVRVLEPAEVLREVLGSYEPAPHASDRLYAAAPWLSRYSPARSHSSTVADSSRCKVKSPPLLPAAAEVRPRVVTLCGSTRFKKAFEAKTMELTLQGVIVLSVGSFTKSDQEIGLSPEQKRRLDVLHLRKIDISDGIVVLNLDGYIGESTLRELAYAIYRTKDVDWLDPVEGERYLQRYRHELGKLVAGYAMGAA